MHSRATIIKLHGDYLDQRSLNTAEELASYPAAQKKLLAQVLDEYGLIVCGWSADWDTALVNAIENTRSRRYTMVWSAYGTIGEKAGDLIAQHDATVIHGMSADEFFPDVVKRLEALALMSETPISRDMTVARLKRAITAGDRIEIFDTVDRSTTKVLDSALNTERHPVWVRRDADDVLPTVFGTSLKNYRAEADTVLHLLATGAFHDSASFDRMWLRPVSRLFKMRKAPPNVYHDALEKLRHYPALLAVFTVGVAAVLAGREELLAQLMIDPIRPNPLGDNDPPPSAAVCLSPVDILEEAVLAHPAAGLQGKGWFPQSHQVRTDIREPLRDIEPDDDVFQEACSRFELLASMLAIDAGAGAPLGCRYPWLGEYVQDRSWQTQHGLAARIGQEITENWPLIQGGAFGGLTRRAHAALATVSRWNRYNSFKQ